MGTLFSVSARSTPTWAMPRAAPPESARPMVRRSTDIKPELYRTQRYNLCTLPRGLEKRGRIRFDLGFDQSRSNLFFGLCQFRDDPTRGTCPEPGNVNVVVVIGDLLVANHHEITKTK